MVDQELLVRTTLPSHVSGKKSGTEYRAVRVQGLGKGRNRSSSKQERARETIVIITKGVSDIARDKSGFVPVRGRPVAGGKEISSQGNDVKDYSPSNSINCPQPITKKSAVHVLRLGALAPQDATDTFAPKQDKTQKRNIPTTNRINESGKTQTLQAAETIFKSPFSRLKKLETNRARTKTSKKCEPSKEEKPRETIGGTCTATETKGGASVGGKETDSNRESVPNSNTEFFTQTKILLQNDFDKPREKKLQHEWGGEALEVYGSDDHDDLGRIRRPRSNSVPSFAYILPVETVSNLSRGLYRPYEDNAFDGSIVDAEFDDFDKVYYEKRLFGIENEAEATSYTEAYYHYDDEYFDEVSKISWEDSFSLIESKRKAREKEQRMKHSVSEESDATEVLILQERDVPNDTKQSASNSKFDGKRRTPPIFIIPHTNAKGMKESIKVGLARTIQCFDCKSGEEREIIFGPEARLGDTEEQNDPLEVPQQEDKCGELSKVQGESSIYPHDVAVDMLQTEENDKIIPSSHPVVIETRDQASPAIIIENRNNEQGDSDFKLALEHGSSSSSSLILTKGPAERENKETSNLKAMPDVLQDLREDCALSDDEENINGSPNLKPQSARECNQTMHSEPRTSQLSCAVGEAVLEGRKSSSQRRFLCGATPDNDEAHADQTVELETYDEGGSHKRRFRENCSDRQEGFVKNFRDALVVCHRPKLIREAHNNEDDTIESNEETEKTEGASLEYAPTSSLPSCEETVLSFEDTLASCEDTLISAEETMEGIDVVDKNGKVTIAWRDGETILQRVPEEVPKVRKKRFLTVLTKLPIYRRSKSKGAQETTAFSRRDMNGASGKEGKTRGRVKLNFNDSKKRYPNWKKESKLDTSPNGAKRNLTTKKAVLLFFRRTKAGPTVSNDANMQEETQEPEPLPNLDEPLDKKIEVDSDIVDNPLNEVERENENATPKGEEITCVSEENEDAFVEMEDIPVEQDKQAESRCGFLPEWLVSPACMKVSPPVADVDGDDGGTGESVEIALDGI